MQENEHKPQDETTPPQSDEQGRLAEAYRSPQAPAQDLVFAELIEGPPVQKPRIWPCLLVAIVALPIALVIAGSVLALAAIADAGVDVLKDGSLQRWLEKYSQTRLGLLVLVIPGQAVFFFIALCAALVSPQPLTRRLGLRRGPLPLWTWAVFAIATPVVGLASSQVLSLLVDEMSDQLKMMEAMMQAHTDNFLIGLILVVAVVPGVVEELMFRGYLQSRLAERWHAVPAIVVSALFFSLAHMDPIHMLGVVPLGLWLGAVAWRADSVWPAMICHSANNAVAVVGTKYGQMPTLDFALDPMTMVALAISFPAFLLSLYIFRSN